MDDMGDGEGLKGPEKTLRFQAMAAVFCLLCLAITSACSMYRSMPSTPRERVTITVEKVPLLGFTIQAGAFTVVDNASRFADYLNSYDLEAYYYISDDGFYRVRFGDFRSREAALRKAEELKKNGIIEEYYIVRPDQQALFHRDVMGDLYVRHQLIDTAHSFIGVPYQWGGASEEEGFDCSGLTMAVYRLNGFNLPRSSREQFGVGTPIDRISLSEGDLVFFDTRGRGTVSHVGIYVGNGRFIHAPRSGRKVTVDSLDNSYYRRRFLGGRSYL